MTKILTCWKCGGMNLLETPTMTKPVLRKNGDFLIFTVCRDCWTENEFVNGKAARIVIELR